LALPRACEREIEKKERARGQDSKRARGQERMLICEDVKMRRCEYVKMFDRPPLLEEPFAQTLSGKKTVWWFGTFFHSVRNVIIPTDELIFFRGVETIFPYMG